MLQDSGTLDTHFKLTTVDTVEEQIIKNYSKIFVLEKTTKLANTDKDINLKTV